MEEKMWKFKIYEHWISKVLYYLHLAGDFLIAILKCEILKTTQH